MAQRFRRLNLPNNVLYDKEKKKYGIGVTITLIVLILCIVSIMWALFISGPVRLQEEILAQRMEKMEEEVPGIMGITQHTFDYVTYNGYTESTLYWFDENCEIITTREIETLDYNKAKEVALNEYGIEAVTIELTFGYNTPCYEIVGENELIMLDYDTLSRVYQRQVN
jgi:hypothetical protein